MLPLDDLGVALLTRCWPSDCDEAVARRAITRAPTGGDKAIIGSVVAGGMSEQPNRRQREVLMRRPSASGADKP